MATEEKEISSIGEDMPLVDKDYENNKTGEINEPELFDSEPLILDKEYNLENNKNSNNLIALTLLGACFNTPPPLIFICVPLPSWLGKKGLIFFAASCCSGPFLPDNIKAI